MADQLALEVAAGGATSSAVISDCGGYRYELTRRWDDGPLLGWVMLNPSTADASVDDPTIRRCIGFARNRGFSGIVVRNLFALRATDPRELLGAADPIGPDNTYYLRRCEGDPMTVAAWGANKAVQHAWPSLRTVKCASSLMCLGTTGSGAPCHPLYLRTDTKFQPFQIVG